jgi:hypothetical protein
MATGQIAILEGYQLPRYAKMPRKRKRRGFSGSDSPFAIVAKRCRKKHKKSAKAFWACVRKASRKGRKSSRRGRKACPPGCRKG